MVPHHITPTPSLQYLFYQGRRGGAISTLYISQLHILFEHPRPYPRGLSLPHCEAKGTSRLHELQLAVNYQR